MRWCRVVEVAQGVSEREGSLHRLSWWQQGERTHNLSETGVGGRGGERRVIEPSTCAQSQCVCAQACALVPHALAPHPPPPSSRRRGVSQPHHPSLTCVSSPFPFTRSHPAPHSKRTLTCAVEEQRVLSTVALEPRNHNNGWERLRFRVSAPRWNECLIERARSSLVFCAGTHA